MNVALSIIIPILNMKEYVSQCLDSVVSQTLKDIEIICVDGGSTDGTLEIIKEYEKRDERISILSSSVRSYGYQMNMGLEAAQGEYVGIVEPDDFIDRKMFQIMFEKTEMIGKADFVKGGFFQYAEAFGDYLMKTNACLSEKVDNKLIILNNNDEYRLYDLNHIWSAIYKRSFLVDNVIRFNETPGASFQDTSFSILVGILAESCIYSNDCFYYYRIDNPSSSVKSNTKVTCVVDEYRFVMNELLIRGKNDEKTISAIQKQKLKTYRWNYLRLSKEGRKLFLHTINKELEQYSEEFVKNELSPEELSSYVLLSSADADDILKQREKKIKNDLYNICKLLKGKTPCVLVGCGSFGEKILLMQRLLKEQTIVAVCDNSKQKQKTHFHDYVVAGVEYTVSDFPEAIYIVANKYRNSEIVYQINDLGINNSNIFTVSEMPPLPDIVSVCCQFVERR